MVVLTALLGGCGGGGGDDLGGANLATTAQQQQAGASMDGNGEQISKRALGTAPGDVPASRAEAARFLNQATFGATETQINRVMALGYSGWIEEQFNKPRSNHLADWEEWEAAAKAETGNSIGQDGVVNSFWKSAVSGQDQLRQRVAYSLSQIFVISMLEDTVSGNPRGVSHYMDLLANRGLDNYRYLLEGVARHPMMGFYLSSIHNRKADPATGRVPDENFARESMQLFSIGLHELQQDGQPKLVNGKRVETFTSADITGLAKVFTGWSSACPAYPADSCFLTDAANGAYDPDRRLKPMVGYPKYHASEEKRFLGTVIPAQSPADPEASMKIALDTLAQHPNVGPFIGKQLIQKMVTSNPSPAYVAAVAAAFDDNGQGVRGDMKAVVRAVLLHPQARATSNTSGLVRDPLLRVTAYLRAFGYTSDTNRFRVGNTDNAVSSLGMTPMRAPSVFNFHRPGYVPPRTQAASLGLSVPEMQSVQETTAASYVNVMRDTVAYGWGQHNVVVNGVKLNRRDMQADFSAELALADRPDQLMDRISAKLMPAGMPAALRTEIETTLGKMKAPPALYASGSNQKQVDEAKRNRVNAALLMTLASPEYQVQK